MKNILGALLLVSGVYSAYAAGPLQFTNYLDRDVAGECFPSQHSCNGVGVGGGTCTCPDTDTYMYFGRFGAPADETTYLIPHTMFTGAFLSGHYTGLHLMGDGKVFKIIQNPEDPRTENCDASGFNDEVGCSFNQGQ